MGVDQSDLHTIGIQFFDTVILPLYDETAGCLIDILRVTVFNFKKAHSYLSNQKFIYIFYMTNVKKWLCITYKDEEDTCTVFFFRYRKDK